MRKKTANLALALMAIILGISGTIVALSAGAVTIMASANGFSVKRGRK